MCGIAGIFSKKLDPEKLGSALKSMQSAIGHRGPDSNGIFVEDSIGLAHTRLAIIDLSPAGHQPMFSDDENIALSFNGEIYNFEEIKSQITDYPFKSKTDTELIIAAYKKWGIKSIEKLNGMFVLSIWDKKKKELFIARDRLGIKPLYFYKEEDSFLFSSEVRSLLASNLVPKKLNKQSLFEYFTYQTVHAPQTLVNNVYELLPGHYITITHNAFEIEEYWKPSTSLNKDVVDHSKDEVLKNINTLLNEAVEKRLMSDVPYGAFLSGGIDSSIIVGLMSKSLSNPVKTFTVTFDESEFSEAKYAETIAKRFNTDHTEIKLSPQDFLDEMPSALKALDHPSGDGPNSYIVSKVTKESGVTMAMSGLGGDELFAGYPVFTNTLKLEQLKWIWSVPSALRKPVGSLIDSIIKKSSTGKLKELISNDELNLYQSLSLSRKISLEKELKSFLNLNEYPDPVSKILSNQIETEKDNIPLLSKVSIAEITTYMQNVLLRDTDQMSMAHALEVRVPFLDHELVEYVLGVPDKFKTPDYPKKLLIESVAGLLPDEIVHRKKMGFTFPWAKWLKNDLLELCDTNIKALAEREFIHKNDLLKRWNNFLKGDNRIRWTEMWLCVVLEQWLKDNGIDS
ncbi:MAG: asparagine synthase (glutamine-hydrolyzing) [Bacteroidia bacterium]|nr:asparagine synthase (glutamine-hydrolyzing) [Bacteroidia bacterium]